MNKKFFYFSIFFIIILTFYLLSFSTTSQPTSSLKKEDIVSLRVTTMFAGADPAAQLYEQALRDFTEQHPYVQIIDESLPSGDAFRTKVKTDFAAGNEADVTFFFMGVDAKTLIASGRVLPFDSFLDADPTWKDGFAPSVLNEIRHTDGQIYSLPITGFYEGLFCNTDLFNDFNLPLPTDWDSLLTAITVFSETDIIPMAASLDESYYLLDAFLLSAAGATEDLYQLNEQTIPYWILALKSIQEIYQLKAFPENSFTLQDIEARQLFSQKKAAMMINGSWIISGLEDKTNTTIIPFPVIPAGKADPFTIIAGHTSGFFLSKFSHEDPNKQGLALALIQFLTQPKMIEDFAYANYGIPASTFKIQSPYSLLKDADQMIQNATHFSKPIDFDMAPDAFLEIRRLLPFIVKDQISSHEALEEVSRIFNRMERTKDEL
ncbi:MAG: extracellular solute-binding protein [Epulopiscium sp.]|nr:extracellular solute-binding protein [Candidatus Epulonipiscium sp.]